MLLRTLCYHNYPAFEPYAEKQPSVTPLLQLVSLFKGNAPHHTKWEEHMPSRILILWSVALCSPVLFFETCASPIQPSGLLPTAGMYASLTGRLKGRWTAVPNSPDAVNTQEAQIWWGDSAWGNSIPNNHWHCSPSTHNVYWLAGSFPTHNKHGHNAVTYGEIL